MAPAPQSPTRFGRAKFGGSQRLLLSLSAISGLSIAVAFGALVALTKYQEHPSLALAIFTACLAPTCSALVWALLVDRTTITGATLNPENSIETHWYSQAAQDTFHAALVAVGILGLASTFWSFSLTGSQIALADGALLLLVFSASYGLRTWTTN